MNCASMLDKCSYLTVIMAVSVAVSCPALTVSAHVVLSSTEMTLPGDGVSFTCDRNYELLGPTNITCLLGGNWNEPLPICELGNLWNSSQRKLQTELRYIMNALFFTSILFTTVTCPALILSVHVIPSSQLDQHPGDTVSFTCDENYELKGPSLITCVSGGHWSETPPTCEGNHPPTQKASL